MKLHHYYFYEATIIYLPQNFLINKYIYIYTHIYANNRTVKKKNIHTNLGY